MPALLQREFLEAIRERADRNYKGKLQQAFVDWYIEAEFGRNADWRFTDDAGDGGIDAIVWRPGERPPVVVLQSKFSERIGGAMLNPRAYNDFSKVIDAFYRPEEVFDEFLARVREDAKGTYRRAERALAEIGHWKAGKRAFRLITTCRPRHAAKDNRVPESAYCHADDVLELYRQYRKGHTPRATDLELQVDQKLEYRDRQRGVTSYSFNARLSDFRKYFEHNEVDRLVARNIRYNLAGRIGKAIRRSYENQPHDFWYLHNGLTVICDGYRQRNGAATLENPSVVNGAQTLYAISSSPRKRSNACVTVRVIVRTTNGHEHEDDAWVQSVIRGVNTQNRVRNVDFRSNEPEQVELQRLFREQDVFYERKRGEFREYRNDPRARRLDRASMRSVGMALTAVSEDDGSGVVLVKRGVDAIFDADNYRKLFPDRRRIRRRFEHIYLVYRAMNFVRDSAFRGERVRKYRHAYWTAVWLMVKGITDQPRFFSHASLGSIRDGFDRLESRTLAASRGRAEIKRLRNDLWKAWRKFSRRDRGKWTPVNFFKSRPAHQRLASTVYPRHRANLRAIGKELLS